MDNEGEVRRRLAERFSLKDYAIDYGAMHLSDAIVEEMIEFLNHFYMAFQGWVGMQIHELEAAFNYRKSDIESVLPKLGRGRLSNYKKLLIAAIAAVAEDTLEGKPTTGSNEAMVFDAVKRMKDKGALAGIIR